MTKDRYSNKFLQKLSFPRMAGTKGEKKAQRLIEEELASLGIDDYQTQEFTYSWFYMNILLRVYDILTSLLIIFGFLLIIFQRFYLTLIIAIVLFIYCFFSRQIREFLQFKVSHLGKEYESKNYIIQIPAKQPENGTQNVVFLAHYDSISHKLHPLFSGALYFFALVGGSIFSVHLIMTVILDLKTMIQPYLLFSYGFLIAFLISLQIANSRGNKSPGTGDNATAVANAFYLLKYFRQNPLSRTNLTFVFTGAEEAGDFGAYNFIKEYASQLDVQETYFIITDTVAVNEKENLYFYGQGFPKRIFSPYLKKKTEKVLSASEKYQGKLSSVYIPPLIAYSTDHVPLKSYNYEFIIFGSNGRIHSKEDNLDHFHPELMHNFNEFSRDLLIELDSA
ncbi:MAG: M20/M25/M40 family metallo-hydrolase [Promethearchaeia archaeon]